MGPLAERARLEASLVLRNVQDGIDPPGRYAPASRVWLVVPTLASSLCSTAISQVGLAQTQPLETSILEEPQSVQDLRHELAPWIAVSLNHNREACQAAKSRPH